MNDMRGRLIELLTDNLPRIGEWQKCDNPLQYKDDEIVGRLADHLLANGITVQEWIPVEDRLPEDGEHILVRYSDDWICDEYSPVDDGVTHWMPLPKPPEGG